MKKFVIYVLVFGVLLIPVGIVQGAAATGSLRLNGDPDTVSFWYATALTVYGVAAWVAAKVIAARLVREES